MPTLEERVAALEGKFDAHTMSTTDLRGALTELQADMNRRFDRVDQRFERIDQRFDRVDQRFDVADQKIDRHFTWLVGIVIGGFIAVITSVAGAFFGLLQMIR